MDEGRLNREKEYHDQRYQGAQDTRSRLSKFYAITRHNIRYFEALVLELCAGADLLEYGCGKNSRAELWGRAKARVVGIDLSEAAITATRRAAAEKKLTANFLVMNAEDLEFPAASFDVVAGTGILHHLDLDRAGRELSRVLRSDGHAIFIEPLGHNLAINIFRKLTPAARTSDEHPLLMRDIKKLRNYFAKVEKKHFHILTLLAVPFQRLPFFNALLNLLHGVDSILMFLLPFLKRYSWIVVLDLSQPKKGPAG